MHGWLKVVAPTSQPVVKVLLSKGCKYARRQLANYLRICILLWEECAPVLFLCVNERVFHSFVWRLYSSLSLTHTSLSLKSWTLEVIYNGINLRLTNAHWSNVTYHKTHKAIVCKVFSHKSINDFNYSVIFNLFLIKDILLCGVIS